MQRKEPQVSESADEQRPSRQETLDAMLDAIRQAKVSELILSTVSTLASVAYGKLELKELDEAKQAIDAIDALLPLLEGQRRGRIAARLHAGAGEPEARLTPTPSRSAQ